MAFNEAVNLVSLLRYTLFDKVLRDATVLPEKEGRVGGRPKVVVSTTKIRRLADQGLSAVEIGARLGCGRMTVARRLAEI